MDETLLFPDPSDEHEYDDDSSDCPRIAEDQDNGPEIGD